MREGTEKGAIVLRFEEDHGSAVIWYVARCLVGPLMFMWSLSGGAATVIDEAGLVGRSDLVTVLVAELLW